MLTISKDWKNKCRLYKILNYINYFILIACKFLNTNTKNDSTCSCKLGFIDLGDNGNGIDESGCQKC